MQFQAITYILSSKSDYYNPFSTAFAVLCTLYFLSCETAELALADLHQATLHLDPKLG